ncbi:MAG: TrkA family potassium uptake protein [Lachnospiraceae bacterium]|nr:TrkA family potassium uptake protein [Lachnospiraceae bacterium]
MKSILLVGLGNFGVSVAKEIHELGHQVMAVDIDEERVNEILPYVTNAQIGDSTNEEFLRSIGINDYDVCIVAIGEDFQNSLETTSLLKELGANYVVSLADGDVHAKFLLRNGADSVVNPEKMMAKWTAIRYTSNNILDYIKLDDNHAIYEVTVPESWIGKSIMEIDIRKNHGINILATKVDGQMSLTVNPMTVFHGNESILVLGELKSIQKCFKI